MHAANEAELASLDKTVPGDSIQLKLPDADVWSAAHVA